ncbi:MAG: NOL1/NOP2/fmu family ribosome biogenesis protein, partial [Rhodothermales bacterium]
LWLGHRVTRQIVDLDQDAAWQYIRGQRVGVQPSQGNRYGYVQVRCLGVPLGVGLYDPDLADLESLYPRQWGGMHRPSG